MMIATQEPEGSFVRNVSPLRAQDVEHVWKKLRAVTNFAGGRGKDTLTDPSLEILRVDDVGVVVLDDKQSEYGRVHITFWDKRLRGREYLCKRIAQVWIDKYRYDYVYTSIPSESRAVIAFAKRVGFDTIAEEDGFVHLIFYNDLFTPSK